MTKKYMTFKHWKTDEVKTIEFREADVPVNPGSERLVVWNETEQKLEDVIKSTIVEIREEQPVKPAQSALGAEVFHSVHSPAVATSPCPERALLTPRK